MEGTSTAAMWDARSRAHSAVYCVYIYALSNLLDHLTIVYVSSNSPPSEFQLLLLLNPYGVMSGQDEGGMLEEEGKRQTP